MSLEQLMENPYAWLVLSLISVFGILFSIFTWIANKEKKKISYYIDSYKIVRAGKNVIPEFEILYSGQPICDLTVSRFAIWNSGNRVLNSSDIVDTKPISIMSDDSGPDILAASVIKCSEESDAFIVTKKSNHCAEIKFDYVDKQDGVVIQILHTGSVNNITVSGLIKGGKKLKNVEKHSPRIKNKKVLKILAAVMISVEMALLLIMTAISVLEKSGLMEEEFAEFMQSTPKLNPVIEEIFLVALCIITFITYYQFIKSIFYLNIPSDLRDSIEYKKQ